MQDEFRVIARRSCPTRDNAAYPFVIALHHLEWSAPLTANLLGRHVEKIYLPSLQRLQLKAARRELQEIARV
jgi:hypothetical protein